MVDPLTGGVPSSCRRRAHPVQCANSDYSHRRTLGNQSAYDRQPEPARFRSVGRAWLWFAWFTLNRISDDHIFANFCVDAPAPRIKGHRQVFAISLHDAKRHVLTSSQRSGLSFCEADETFSQTLSGLQNLGRRFVIWHRAAKPK